MCEHMLNMGGIDYYESLAAQKSSTLYSFLDKSMRSSDQYRFVNNVDPKFRSRMNIPFNIGDEQTEAELLKELKKEGFIGLKGHGSLGGVRASIYNSLEYKHVVSLCEFLERY